MMYLMVAGGLVILLLGGDLLVRGAVTLAQRLDVPPLVIGLTVVAFGTSSPELVVSVEAALKGVPEIAIGNVVGSNIANVLLVLGVPALLLPLTCDATAIRRESAIMAGVTVVFILLCLTGSLQAWQGALMTAALVAYLSWSYYNARNQEKQSEEMLAEEIEGIGVRPQSLWISLGFVAFGFAGLVIGSDMLIHGAVDIARLAGLSPATIGLTLIALGTSLPELATSLVAAVRRHGDVAVGNVIGSNLFNILSIMGITAMIRPIPVPPQFIQFDLWVMLGTTLLIIPFVARGSVIGRPLGLLLAGLYVGYVTLLLNGQLGMLRGPTEQIAF